MTTAPKITAFVLVLTCLILPALACLFPPVASAAPHSTSPRRDVIAGPMTGEVTDILDGDTVNVRIHVWIGQTIETSVRIDGIDTPEIKGKCAAERDKAVSARKEIGKLIGNGNKIKLSNIRLEKYAGRVLATATTTEGVDIAGHMIQKGLARAYSGEKRAGWCNS